MGKLGIDFGTTNSLAVTYDKNEGKFNYFSFVKRKPTPTSSTVWFHDGTSEVGNNARKKMYDYADVDGHHFERSIKLKLGTGKKVSVFGDLKEPYEIASLIIKQLKDDALKSKSAKAGLDLDQAVFTIPVNFNGKQREELRKSAHAAGVEITSFIHEPLAAIVGYYFTMNNGNYTKVMDQLAQMEGQYILTFDWGGGTLDITVVRVQDGKMMEVGTSELTGMAGDKLDELLAELAWSRFADEAIKKYTKEQLEQMKNEKWGKLLATAENVKISLSEQEQTEFFMQAHGDDFVEEMITREDFERVIENTLTAALNKIQEALNIADLNEINISHVLLTGGTCYIPAVQNAIIKKFGHRVEAVTDADLLIAQGAAVISEMGWMPFLAKDVLIQLSDDSYWPLFEKGLLISSSEEAHNSEDFICTDSRNKRAKIIVSEGIGQKSDKMLTALNVPLLGDRNFGDEVVVEGTIDKNIVLKVRGYSRQVIGYEQPTEEYSIRINRDVNQLCFGLDFRGKE